MGTLSHEPKIKQDVKPRRKHSGEEYIHTYIRAYIRTYVHTYVHTNIHTYMHTYVYTYRTPAKRMPR